VLVLYNKNNKNNKNNNEYIRTTNATATATATAEAGRRVSYIVAQQIITNAQIT
jgi:hypothetical protein